MAESSPVRVLIVGAGVAGLGAALALQDHPDLQIRVVERRTKDQICSGANLAIPPNGTRALERLLPDYEGLLSQGAELEHYELRSAADKLISGCSLQKLCPEQNTPYLSISRRALLSSLIAALQPSLIQFETAYERPCFKEEGVGVSIDGGEEVFDLILAADGVHSGLRREFYEDQQADPVGQFSWRCSVVWPDDCPAPQGQVVYSSRGRTFLLIPQGKGRVYIYAAIVSSALEETRLRPSRAALSRPQYLALLFSHFKGLVPLALKTLTEQCDEESILAAPLFETHAQRWGHEGRLLLIGDAAHASSPSMAQGAALALEDALVLGELFEKKKATDLLAALISDFELRRRPRTDHVKIQSRSRDAILKKKALSPVLEGIVDLTVRFKGLKKLQQEGMAMLIAEQP